MVWLLHMQQAQGIQLVSCFCPSDKCKSNIYFCFSYVFVLTSSVYQFIYQIVGNLVAGGAFSLKTAADENL